MRNPVRRSKVKLPSSYNFLPTASNLLRLSSSLRSLLMIMAPFYVILSAAMLGALASDRPGASICNDKNEPNGLCADNNVGRVVHRGLAACNPTDRDGSPLESSDMTAEGLVACHYHGSPCTYSADGKFSTGPGTCPLATEPTDGPSVPTDGQEDCHLAHDNSGVLMSNDPADGFLACGKGSPYPANFQFETDPAITGNVKKPFPIAAACPSADKRGGALLSSSMTKDGFIACQYTNGYCTYFTNGNFSSGSSKCPSSAERIEPEIENPRPAPCSVTGTDGATLIEQGCKGISPECTYVMRGAFKESSANLSCFNFVPRHCPHQLASSAKFRRKYMN